MQPFCDNSSNFSMSSSPTGEASIVFIGVSKRFEFSTALQSFLSRSHIFVLGRKNYCLPGAQLWGLIVLLLPKAHVLTSPIIILKFLFASIWRPSAELNYHQRFPSVLIPKPIAAMQTQSLLAAASLVVSSLLLAVHAAPSAEISGRE